MGRALGSPNLEYRWLFTLYDPTVGSEEQNRVILFQKRYISVNDMANDMKSCYTASQLRSFASGSRKSPGNLCITRICEPVRGE